MPNFELILEVRDSAYTTTNMMDEKYDSLFAKMLLNCTDFCLEPFFIEKNEERKALTCSDRNDGGDPDLKAGIDKKMG